MALYSSAFRTTNVTTGQCSVEIIAGSTVPIRIYEVGISLVATTATVLAFGIPAANGVGGAGAITPLVEQDSGLPGSKTTIYASTWGTSAPTVGTTWARRVSLPNLIGVGVIWTFPRGYYVPVNGHVCIQNITGGSTLDAWVVLDE